MLRRHQSRVLCPWDGRSPSSNITNIKSFIPELFKTFYLKDVMDHLRGLDPADPALPVRVPGDPEKLSMAEVSRLGGIRYTPNHIVCYKELAEQLGVKPMQRMENTPMN